MYFHLYSLQPFYKPGRLAVISLIYINMLVLGFPGGSDKKESACNAGDQGSIPGSGISPEEGTGYPLQYSCLEIPWTEAIVHGLQRVGHD